MKPEIQERLRKAMAKLRAAPARQRWQYSDPTCPHGVLNGMPCAECMHDDEMFT